MTHADLHMTVVTRGTVRGGISREYDLSTLSQVTWGPDVTVQVVTDDDGTVRARMQGDGVDHCHVDHLRYVRRVEWWVMRSVTPELAQRQVRLILAEVMLKMLDGDPMMDLSGVPYRFGLTHAGAVEMGANACDLLRDRLAAELSALADMNAARHVVGDLADHETGPDGFRAAAMAWLRGGEDVA